MQGAIFSWDLHVWSASHSQHSIWTWCVCVCRAPPYPKGFLFGELVLGVFNVDGD